MHQIRSATPRSHPVRKTIAVELYADELSHLIAWRERDAAANAEDPAREGFADWLAQRAAQLREAMR